MGRVCCIHCLYAVGTLPGTARSLRTGGSCCLGNLSMLRGSYALLSGYEAATSPSPENQSPFEYPYLAVVRGHLSASPPGSVHYPSVALSVTVLEARALRKRFQWRRADDQPPPPDPPH